METSKIISAIKSDNSSLLVNELYKTAFPPIKKYIRSKYGSNDDAEDCFQEAILSLIKKIKIGTYNESHEVKNFLFILSRNIWFNKVKRMGKFSSQEIENFQVQDDSATGEAVIIESERQKALEELMSSAGSKCKELMRLMLFENKKVKEIVGIMGFSSEDVVKTTNYRCKQKLKTALINNPQLMEVLKG